MIYAVLMFLLFVNGMAIGLAAGIFLGYAKWKRPEAARQGSGNPTEDEIARAKREREELIESQKAFQGMMGYNADIAYGIGEDDLNAGGS